MTTPIGGTPPSSEPPEPSKFPGLAEQLNSASRELTQSLRQILSKPALADNPEFLRHISESIKNLHEPTKQAANIPD